MLFSYIFDDKYSVRVLYCNYIQTLQRQASEELKIFLFLAKKRV